LDRGYGWLKGKYTEGLKAVEDELARRAKEREEPEKRPMVRKPMPPRPKPKSSKPTKKIPVPKVNRDGAITY